MNIQAIAPAGTPKAEDRVATEAPAPAPAIARNAGNRPAAAGVAAPSRDQLDAAVKHINQSMPASAQGLEFSVDDDSKETVVKIVDRNTQEVLRQIPSREALEIAKSLDKAMGKLIDQRA